MSSSTMDELTQKRLKAQEDFLKDVKIHKMTILREDGIHRHLRFRRPESYNMGFDIITWPGHLCYTGDMGTFVFARIDDMFDFFIIEKSDFNHLDGVTLNTNPGYWAEKILSTSRFGGFEEYDSEAFEQNVMEHFERHFEDKEDCDKEKEAVLEEINDTLLGERFSQEYEAHQAIYDFSCYESDFEFVDFWESRLVKYTFHYLWGCRAIVWGILKYQGKI